MWGSARPLRLAIFFENFKHAKRSNGFLSLSQPDSHRNGNVKCASDLTSISTLSRELISFGLLRDCVKEGNPNRLIGSYLTKVRALKRSVWLSKRLNHN